MNIRVIPEVVEPGKCGPVNGQYAMHKALREADVPWLVFGGEPEEGELPWFHRYTEKKAALDWASKGGKFILGPNVFFHRFLSPGTEEYEKQLLNCPNCVAYITESPWYVRLVKRNLGPRFVGEVLECPHPIVPVPDPPLPVEYDCLLYLKSGYHGNLEAWCRNKWRTTKVLKYGEYEREDLIKAARRSRLCIYASDNDRGPLALMEILLSGCPAIGTPWGAPWIVPGVNGRYISSLHPYCVEPALEYIRRLDREAVRANALERFTPEVVRERIVGILSLIRERVGQTLAVPSQ